MGFANNEFYLLTGKTQYEIGDEEHADPELRFQIRSLRDERYVVERVDRNIHNQEKRE